MSPGETDVLLLRLWGGGNVITFLMEYENYTFPEALKALADRAGVDLPRWNTTRRPGSRRTLGPGF